MQRNYKKRALCLLFDFCYSLFISLNKHNTIVGKNSVSLATEKVTILLSISKNNVAHHKVIEKILNSFSKSCGKNKPETSHTSTEV